MRALAAFLCLLVSAGCFKGKGDRKAPPSLGLNLSPVEVFSDFPVSFLQGTRFRARIATPERILLDGDYELEFSAALPRGAAAESLPITTYILSGGDEIRLFTGAAWPLGFRNWSPAQGFRAAAQRFNLDLSSFRGKAIGLKWVLGDGSGDHEAYLLSPRLRAKASAAQQPPDVLFVCSDTHRFDHSLGDHGKTLMPELQRLAAQSVVYRKAMSTATWTQPAVTSVLTGLTPRFHLTGQKIPGNGTDFEKGAKGYFQWRIGEGHDLAFTSYPKDLTSLPEILWSHGYLSAIVAANPLYGLSGLLYDGTQIATDSGGSGDLLNSVVEQVLSDVPRDQPVFLLVHYMDVHDWELTHFKKLYPNVAPEAASREQFLESYAAAVRQSDQFLAQLLDLWSGKRAIDNTLLVFFSDHGEHLLDPILGHGNSMSQVLLHVPLVIRYPAASGIAPSAVDHNVSLADVFATSLDVLGISHEFHEFQGRSLLGPADSKRLLFADFQLFGESLSSVIKGNEKLVVNLDKGSLEFFHVAESGDEESLTSSAGNGNALRTSFREYTAAAERYASALPSRQFVDRKKVLETLKSLGYIR